MRTHHAGASARLDLAYERESAEKEAHHHNKQTKQPNARKPRPRPLQKKRSKRTDGAQDMAGSEHADDIEAIVQDEMPTEFESLYELSENHPRFGHRMGSKRRRGKKGGGGTGVTGTDSGDDSVESDDYSIGIDEQSAEMLADLVLCAGSDDSGSTENHEGTEEERRFARMDSFEVDMAAPQDTRTGAQADATRHALPGALRTSGSEPAARGFAARANVEPKATREWAEAALLALVQRNRPEAVETLQLVQPAGSTSVTRPTRGGKVNVLPAAVRVLQRFLAQQAITLAAAAPTAKTRSDKFTAAVPSQPGRRGEKDGAGVPGHRARLPFAATVEAARQRLVDGTAAYGHIPAPKGTLGHEQELFNLTVVLFQLALHTPRLPAQLGIARARRRTLDRRMIGAE
ncbi:hypothetical protein [Robbsia sp. KACC 23696]|uniref:hypothetical protein n=1 Tax=Robbsia sp. KACC 23696 TaxID=3149231 RepID=UPI00325A43AC